MSRETSPPPTRANLNTPPGQLLIIVHVVESGLPSGATSKNPFSSTPKALKTQYEQSGTSAEFYARQNYNNAKLSDYDSVLDFLTALTNLAHLVNKELSSTAGHICNR